mgnify:CR=1 FL=1
MAKYDNPGLLNEPDADPSVYPVFHGISTDELEKMDPVMRGFIEKSRKSRSV